MEFLEGGEFPADALNQVGQFDHALEVVDIWHDIDFC